MVRGGSWNNNHNNARAAYRNDNDPSNRNNNIGLRLVCESAMFARSSGGISLLTHGAVRRAGRGVLEMCDGIGCEPAVRPR